MLVRSFLGHRDVPARGLRAAPARVQGGEGGARGRGRAGRGGAPAAEVPCEAELKGSIGEGPNHSNHSNHSNSFKIGFFHRKFKNFRKFQHFLNYRRNSDKISSKSEQKSVKRIQK